MQLYNFCMSSTSYRVRLALSLKKIDYEYIPVDLRTGKNWAADFREINFAAGVPVLVDKDVVLTQSLAIIDYLDHAYPTPRLIPSESLQRARVLEASYAIACDIHPIDNLRVLNYLRKDLGIDESKVTQWYAHWVASGLSALEKLLGRYGSGPFCFGESATLADCCLVPQVANALRNKCDVDAYPRVMAVYSHAMADPDFKRASPELQPDF
ncbi:maleylacetoacetate isomerase [Trinickia fusca]|uniref:Maleylacetoacetate isomerase n=1 Tax=Trinickia fusca TaxID=2419777 RepID=A0A494X6W4_9BURK|nr:maleylacetoacetate isomerase [Trinickia fusca]RKP46032.1 maleylacetoacetate isomerase [Trinickia fusca]